VHGEHDAIANRRYFDELSMPTLWRGSLQDLPAVGHALHWEAPEAFHRLLEEFVRDCTGCA
jgi:pimeloyl-ACP methyl ester carboxylesterase